MKYLNLHLEAQFKADLIIMGFHLQSMGSIFGISNQSTG